MAGFLITACGVAFTSTSLISGYPQFREGVQELTRDAKSTYNRLNEFGNRLRSGRNKTFVANPSTATGASTTQASTVWINETIDTGVRVQNLFNAATIAMEAYKIYQAEQITKELKDISGNIKIFNNLVAGGGAGPDGFAQHVLDFINVKIAAYTADGKEHRFFLYHPDTIWYGTFARIRQSQGFSHQSFLGFGHDLFVVFRLMLSVRVALEEAMGEAAKDVTFHLLIPSYYSIVIPRALYIVPAIFPLTVDGERAAGDCLVWFNFPHIPTGVLSNIGNLKDCPKSTWKMELARGGSTMATAMAGLWGVTPVVTIAAECIFPPLGVLAFVGAGLGTFLVIEEVDRSVTSIWDELPPALLG